MNKTTKKALDNIKERKNDKSHYRYNNNGILEPFDIFQYEISGKTIQSHLEDKCEVTKELIEVKTSLNNDFRALTNFLSELGYNYKETNISSLIRRLNEELAKSKKGVAL